MRCKFSRFETDKPNQDYCQFSSVTNLYNRKGTEMDFKKRISKEKKCSYNIFEIHTSDFIFFLPVSLPIFRLLTNPRKLICTTTLNYRLNLAIISYFVLKTWWTEEFTDTYTHTHIRTSQHSKTPSFGFKGSQISKSGLKFDFKISGHINTCIIYMVLAWSLLIFTILG